MKDIPTHFAIKTFTKEPYFRLLKWQPIFALFLSNLIYIIPFPSLLLHFRCSETKRFSLKLNADHKMLSKIFQDMVSVSLLLSLFVVQFILLAFTSSISLVTNDQIISGDDLVFLSRNSE